MRQKHLRSVGLGRAARRRWLIVGVVLTFAPACSKPPQLPRLSADATVLAFGDSLTYGRGAAPSQSYPAVLERLTGRRVINAGVPGEVTSEGRRRLPALLDEHRPQLLILIHGGNDLLRRMSDRQAEENLRAMVRAARSRAVAVILVGVPRPSLGLSVPAFYERIAEEFGIPYAPGIVAEIERDPALKSDAIHPNAQGYRRLAERLYALMREAGAV